LAVVDAIEWAQSIHQSNVIFNHKSLLKLRGGGVRFVKTIDLSFFDSQIRIAQKEIMLLRNLSTSNVPSNEIFSTGVEHLSTELRSVYALMGAYRDRRAINFLGSALKYMYGVMDNDDRELIDKTLKRLNDQGQALHDAQESMMVISREESQQARILWENQKDQLENFRKLRNQLEDESKNLYSLTRESNKKNLELHLNNLLLSIQVQIDKLKNAVLFLKAGIIDPFFLDAYELLNMKIRKLLNYEANLSDFPTIIENSKLIAVGNITSHSIHIILTIPAAQPDKTFTLYETVVVPKVTDKGTVILNDIKRFLAVSTDNRQYFEFDNLTCFHSANAAICDNDVVFTVGAQDNCLLNIFYHGNDSSCSYRRLLNYLEVHHRFDTDLLLFSPKKLTVNISCPDFADSKIMSGSYLISIPGGCTVNSSIFQYTNEVATEYEPKSIDVRPQIVCCSEFYIFNASTTPENKTITLTDIKQIHSVSFEKIDSEIKKFKTFHEIPTLNLSLKWKFIIICILIFMIFITYIIIICSCKSNPGSIIVVNGRDEPRQRSLRNRV
jgi:hypothetical protein